MQEEIQLQCSCCINTPAKDSCRTGGCQTEYCPDVLKPLGIAKQNPFMHFLKIYEPFMQQILHLLNQTVMNWAVISAGLSWDHTCCILDGSKSIMFEWEEHQWFILNVSSQKMAPVNVPFLSCTWGGRLCHILKVGSWRRALQVQEVLICSHSVLLYVEVRSPFGSCFS